MYNCEMSDKYRGQLFKLSMKFITNISGKYYK